jgi:hypothetical protein
VCETEREKREREREREHAGVCTCDRETSSLIDYFREVQQTTSCPLAFVTASQLSFLGYLAHVLVRGESFMPYWCSLKCWLVRDCHRSLAFIYNFKGILITIQAEVQ